MRSSARRRRIDEAPAPALPTLPDALAALVKNRRNQPRRSGRGNQSGNRLLSHPRADHRIDLLRWGVAADLYTYQQPLQGRAGPRVEIRGRELISLSSYDYLGLAGHPAVDAAAIDAVRRYGVGTGGVRLLSGTAEIHCEVERAIARFKGVGASITFSSGYAANLAAITALMGPGDAVVADQLVHQSIQDALCLARVSVRRFRHNDMESLARALAKVSPGQRTLIIIEGVYSMEGDIGLLRDVLELRDRYDAMVMVDEAHSIGALGASGRGVDEHFGIDPRDVDVWTGSLSKGVGCSGGYVAGSPELIAYLQHESAPDIFSAAMSPAVAGAVCAALEVIDAEPERVHRARLNARYLRAGLARAGYSTNDEPSPIVPVLVGDDVGAYALARQLLEEGVWVSAVVFPAVPRGDARLRLCATAAHSTADLDAALAAFGRVQELKQ